MLEELVRPNIFSRHILKESYFYGHAVRITKTGIIDISLFDTNTNDSKWKQVTSSNIDSINFEHFSWSNEYGINGFMLRRDNDNNNQWLLYIWQCKGGSADLFIGGGDIDLHLKKYIAPNKKNKYNLSEIDDQQIGGILLKAQIGICQLIKAFQKSVPKIVIIPISITITTTKQISMRNHLFINNSYKMKIDPQIIKINKLNNKNLIWNNAVSNTDINVHIISGVDWIGSTLDNVTLSIFKEMFSAYQQTPILIPEGIQIEERQGIINKN